MKTKEFKQWCGFNGYIVDDTKTLLSVKGSYGVFLTISEICVNTISTGFGLQLDEELFKKAVEYASTPIEEREEEKKFYLIADWLNLDSDNYSYTNLEENGQITFASNMTCTGFQTKFTEKEIEELRKRKVPVDSMRKIEVK